MNSLLRFIILSLACYRLAQLIADDDGPLSIFGRLRQWVDGQAKAEQDQGNGLIWQSVSDGINCPFCIGVWIAAVLAVIFYGFQWYTLVYIFAIAGLQSWLEGIRR